MYGLKVRFVLWCISTHVEGESYAMARANPIQFTISPPVASAAEGSKDAPTRTKMGGAKIITVGACFKACHGNEPGTLKEVVSANTGGPAFIVMGAPIVFVELGMVGITGSPGFLNKNG